MSSRSSAGKGGQNNIDRMYNLTRWLSFQTEQMEKRYTLDFLLRQRFSFIGIILFNVSNIVYGFLSINSLTSILFPILKWLMIICLVISVGIMYLHKSYIERNFSFQILIRISSFYFYCSQYLSVDQLEMGKTATLFMGSALAVSIHMVFTNLLTLPHWKKHVFVNFVYFSIVQLIVFLSSRDASIKLNIIYFIFSQAGLNIFSGFFERFIREFWIHLDVSKKQSAQLQIVIDELPQPILVLDSQCDILLSNFTALKFFQSILPEKENEALPRNITNNPSKILHRLSPPDLKVIEDLIKQVKESEKICTVIFQKQIKNLNEPEKESKSVDLTLIGSRVNNQYTKLIIAIIFKLYNTFFLLFSFDVEFFFLNKEFIIKRKNINFKQFKVNKQQKYEIQWKTQVCTLLQVQEAEKIVEKEIEQKTVTIEKVYEVQNPSNQQENQKSERDPIQSSKGNNMSDSGVTSIQLVQYPQIKPPRPLTIAENVHSYTYVGNPSLKKPKKIESPDQSPINFVSSIEKSSYDMSHLTSTQDHSEGEVNINIDEEIYKHFNFIESGLSNLLTKIISQIQGIKGKKINLSFGSLENSPNVRQYSIGGSHHNISGNKMVNISQNVSGQFYNKNQDLKEPSSPLKPNKGDPKINKKILSTIQNLKRSDIQLQQNQNNLSEVNRMHQIISENSNQIVLPDDSDPENNDNKNYITEQDENSPMNIQFDDISPSSQGSNRIAEINEELEDEVTTTNLSSRRKQIEYRYNEKCTVVLFEESSNTRMTIPYHKYDHLTKINPFSEGEKALSSYFDNIAEGILFNFMILGIEAKNGLGGVEIATKIRNYERENKVPRTHLVALFNSVGSEVGGQTKSADTYLFKGFDQAFEKPINRTVMNEIIVSRANPLIVYQKEEDYVQKYKYFDKFTVLICDDQIQSAISFKEFSEELGIETEVAKSEKSFLNIFYSSIQSGRLYQIYLIAINQFEKQNEIVKQIREYETENKTKKTYIVGMHNSLEHMGLNKNTNISSKCKELGLNEFMEKPIEKEVVQKLIEKLKKNIQQEDKELQSPQKKIQIKFQRSPTLDVSKSQNFTFTKMSTQKFNKNNEPEVDEKELKVTSNSFKKPQESGLKIDARRSFTDFGVSSFEQKSFNKNENMTKQNISNSNNMNSSSKQENLTKTPPQNQQSSRSKIDTEELEGCNIFNKVKQQQVKFGEVKENIMNKTQNDFDELELKANIFNKIKSSGLKIGGQIEPTKEQPVNVNVQNNQKQSEIDELKAASNMFKKVNEKGIKIGGEPQKQNQNNNDDLELKAASNLFKNVREKGIKFGEEQNNSTNQNTQKAQQQNNIIKPQDDEDDLELKQANKLFGNINKKGIKIGGEGTTSSTSINKTTQLQSSQQKPAAQKQEDDDDLELKEANKLFGNINKKGIKIGGDSTSSTTAISKTPEKQPQTQDDADDLELKQANKLFGNINKKGIKIGGDSATTSPVFNKTSQQQFPQQKIASKTQDDNDDLELKQANKLFGNINKKGIKIGGESTTSSASESKTSLQQPKVQEDADDLELKQANKLFGNINKKGIKIGGESTISSVVSSQSSQLQQKAAAQKQEDDDDLELKQANKLFGNINKKGIKIGGESISSTTTASKTSQLKPQIQDDADDLELKQANKLFGNINKKGIKFGGESIQQQQAAAQKQEDDDYEIVHASNQFNNENKKDVKIGGDNTTQKSNPSFQQQSSLQKMPTSVQQQNNKHKPSQDDDDLELKHASNLFSNINKKGIKIGGGESIVSGSTNSQQNKPQQQISSKDQSSISSIKNNDQIQESPYTSSKNSPASQSSQTKIKPKDILASVQIFDQFKKNQAKQQNQEENSKVIVQPISQIQQTSPNVQKHVQPKQVQHKQDNHKQSPVMSISQLSRSPVQSFGKAPNSQIGFQILQTKPTIQYKYNEQPTFLVMEDSSLVMMNISFMKYDIPKVLVTCTTGEVALEKYMSNIKNNILYHFIILGVNSEKGMNGNEVMKKIRQYEQEHNIPRTYILASYNAITQEIGGQILNKEIFVFRGFDDALEKPIKALDMNTLLKSRANPQIIYGKKEDISMKYRFFDRFTILVCDETDQITLTVNSLEVENMEKPVFTWNGQSLFNKYLSSIQGGRLYHFIITGIRVLDLKKEDVVQKIRNYEKENNAPKTYIIGYTKMNQKTQTAEELQQEGYSEIIDSGIQQSDLIKIITRLRLTLKL